IAKSDRFQALEQQYEQRFNEIENKLYAKQIKKISDLENKNQSSWQSVRKELINVNTQFNQANRNLNLQFGQQISELQQDLDEKLSNALEDWSRQRAALQEWAVQRDEMRPSLEEYESRNRNEIIMAINPVRSALRGADRQIKRLRTWTIVNSILTLLALAISGYLLFVQIQTDGLLPTPNQPEPENLN
ncbi:MAG: response regulator, partial [Cyanobacteria bacterium P01_G01_bin.19]